MRRRHAATEAEWAERNETLRKEKESMQKHYRELTKKMKDSRATERSRLQALVEASAEASKAVDAKIARGGEDLETRRDGSETGDGGGEDRPVQRQRTPVRGRIGRRVPDADAARVAEAYARCVRRRAWRRLRRRLRLSPPRRLRNARRSLIFIWAKDPERARRCRRGEGRKGEGRERRRRRDVRARPRFAVIVGFAARISERTRG